MKPVTIRNEAFALRELGYSYGYISKQTGISKSTLSDWLARLPYTPNADTVKRIGEARAASGEAKHNKRVESYRQAELLARKDIGPISKRDIFMLGLGVYIGEGTKSGDQVRVINSNPAIIRLAIRWLKEVCNLEETNFRIRLHIYPDNDEGDCIRFWSEQTGLPKVNFSKDANRFKNK